MSRSIIHSDKAPAAIGAYSQAVRAGNTVYLSGQIPLDPASMEVVAGGFAEQTHQVFKNLTAVIEAAGGSLVQDRGRPAQRYRFRDDVMMESLISGVKLPLHKEP